MRRFSEHVKVLLVQAFLGRKEPGGPVFPLGLAYLAPTLREHQLLVLDLNTTSDPYGILNNSINEFRPDVIGISLRNIDTTIKKDLFLYYKQIAPTVRLIRQTRQDVKIVIGGPGFSMFAREIMQRIPEIDVGIYLEGEESFPELLAHLDQPHLVKGLFFRKDQRILFTGEREFPDFAALPLPDRSILDLKPYLGPYKNIGIQTKRGCPLDCAYCCYPFLNGRRVRIRRPSSIVDEIEELVNRYQIREFMFVDPVFSMPKEYAKGICREIIVRGLDVEWNAYFDPQNVDEDLILLARRAGCNHFMFSPDALTDSGLNHLRKGFRAKEVQKTFALARKIRGARFGFSLFCNYPGQDISGFVKTILFYLKVNFLLLGRGGADLNWIRIEPNTRIHQMAIECRFIDHKTDLLPTNKSDLRGLFFNPRPFCSFDPLLDMGLNLIDKIFKPLMRKVIRRR